MSSPKASKYRLVKVDAMQVFFPDLMEEDLEQKVYVLDGLYRAECTLREWYDHLPEETSEARRRFPEATREEVMTLARSLTASHVMRGALKRGSP